MKEASQSEVDFEQCREGGRLLLFEAVRLYWLNNGRGRPPPSDQRANLICPDGRCTKGDPGKSRASAIGNQNKVVRRTFAVSE